MGGRGSNSGMEGSMNVPYDSWGKEISMQEIRDKNGNVIGHIEDSNVFVQEPEVRPVTKREVLQDIDNWRMDDGSYGDEDTKIYLAYDNGDVIDASDLGGAKYKKKGLIGASISTADYEMVWGDEIHRGQRVPIQTWSESGESGRSNVYSGYKATGVYRIRTKTTYNNTNGRGGYRVKREIIRKSSVKSL